MTATLINRRGYILNTAESAIAYLGRQLERNDLSAMRRFEITNVLDTLSEVYGDAQADIISLSFLETEILFQREHGVLRAM